MYIAEETSVASRLDHGHAGATRMTWLSPPKRYDAGSIQLEGLSELRDVEDPCYFTTLEFLPDRQVLVQTSRLGTGVPVVEKVRWIDQELSHLQSPYPIEHIEFTNLGDAVVQFTSEAARAKAMMRCDMLKWRALDIPWRPCVEDDIKALWWVGLSGCPPELAASARQALHSFGEVRGECPPPQNGHLAQARSSQNGAHMLKYYFVPNSRARLPAMLPVSRSKGSPPLLVRVFAPHGHLAPKCSDFGASHSQFGCPECFRRRRRFHEGA